MQCTANPFDSSKRWVAGSEERPSRMVCFCFFAFVFVWLGFFWPHPWPAEVPKPGMNPRYSSDLSCSNDNAGSLTHEATRELLECFSEGFCQKENSTGGQRSCHVFKAFISQQGLLSVFPVLGTRWKNEVGIPCPRGVLSSVGTSGCPQGLPLPPRQ